MIQPSTPLRMGYVVKMFPRLSETFILNEILELERRGVEVVIFSAKKPNEGRFHPQLSRLKAQVFYLEDLDVKKWPAWIGAQWSVLSGHADRLWSLVGEVLPEADPRKVEQIWHAAWIAARAQELGLTRLHAHFASLPANLAYLTHRVSGIPFSFTAHAKDIFVYAPSESGLREKIEAAEFMVTVTEFNRRYLLEQLPGIDANKIRVVYNGIDLANFQPNGADEQREPGLVLGVGRLVPKKGFGDLLEACALLRDRGVPFRCEIMGGGVEAKNLAAHRQQLGLEREVTFTGPVHQDHVRERLRRAEIFCLPCCVAEDNNVDALPTVLLESLASGLPIVSTDVSGVPEIVTAGVEGDLVAPNDPEHLSLALERLLTDPARRDQFSRSGRAKAESTFDQKENVGRLLSLFESSGSVQTAPEVATPLAALRILHVTTDRGIPFGGTKGASIHVREFLDAFVAEGGSPVAVVRKKKAVDQRAPGFPVHVLDDMGEPAVPATPSLSEAEEFARNRFLVDQLADIPAVEGGFNCVYERYSLFGVAGREYARRAGLPFVLEVNAPLVQEAAAYRGLRLVDVAREVEHYLFSTADHVLTVSEAVADYVRDVALEARVTVVPNGVDTDRFRPGATSAAWRQKVSGGHPDDCVVGFVGRVRPWHGVEILIEAVARARRTVPSLRVCIVGDVRGNEEDIRRQCESLGLADALTILGEVPPAAIPDVLGAMDVLTAPYPQLDSFYFSPLKIFEYMASGRPIVASAIGQVADVLEHDATALLTPPGDVEALSRSLIRLAGDPVQAARLGQAARATAVSEHTWRRRVRTVMDIMSELAARKEVQVS